jgi:hypothetical protein
LQLLAYRNLPLGHTSNSYCLQGGREEEEEEEEETKTWMNNNNNTKQ